MLARSRFHPGYMEAIIEPLTLNIILIICDCHIFTCGNSEKETIFSRPLKWYNEIKWTLKYRDLHFLRNIRNIISENMYEILSVYIGQKA